MTTQIIYTYPACGEIWYPMMLFHMKHTVTLFSATPLYFNNERIYGSSDFHNWHATTPFMSIKCIHNIAPNGQCPLFCQHTSLHPMDMDIWFYAFPLTQQLFQIQFGKVLYYNCYNYNNYSKRHKLRFKLGTSQIQCW